MTGNTDTTAAGASDFDKLIAEITATATDVTKSMADGTCADGESKDGKKKPEDDEVDDEGDEGAAADGDTSVGKAFEVTLSDGSKANAFDATQLIKSLTERCERAEKALGDVFTVVKAQGMQIDALKAAPRGRKSVVTVSEKVTDTAVNKSAVDLSMTGEQFVAKSMDAFTAGRISGIELTRIENLVGKGVSPDKDLIERVLGQ